MKKFITGLIFVLILCLFPFGNEQGYAAQETTDGCVGMKAEYSSLEQGSIVKINIYSNKEYMGELDAEFEYDKSIFEQVTVDDIDTATNYESGQKLHFYGVEYHSDEDLIVLMWHVKKGLPQNNLIATVNFKLKKKIDYTEISMYKINGLYGDGSGDENDMDTHTEYQVDDKLTCSIGGNDLKIASGTSKGSYGENIEVPLKLVKNVGGFSVLGLDVSYDPTVLEYQDTIIDDKYKSVLELKSVYNDVDNKTIKIALVGARDITDTGNFAKIVFKVKESSDSQGVKTTNIGLKATQITNVSGVSVPVTTTGSIISIGVALNVGDVTGDNAINLLDALWILQYYNGVRTFDDSAFKRADVNNSNRVDLVDALMIMKYYNGEIKSFSSR